VRTHLLMATTLVMFCGLVAHQGCRRGPYVYVRQARYMPKLPRALTQAYRGRRVHLASFVNRANNTRIWYYYSADNQVTYEGSPNIAEYLRRCFQRALYQMGMVVYMSRPPYGVPSLKLTLRYWTDRRLSFEVNVSIGGQPVLARRYTVVQHTPRTSDARYLEMMAYHMVNRVVARVFMDRAIWQSVRGGSPGPVVRGPGAAPPVAPGPGTAPPASPPVGPPSRTPAVPPPPPPAPTSP
jgi:hypothetical protein